MKKTNTEYGFTLIEILTAMTLIVIIVSIVYGSFAAGSKTTGLCKDTTALSQKMRGVLDRMSRQLRCSYAPQKYNGRAARKQNQLFELFFSAARNSTMHTEDDINYFLANTDSQAEETVQFVTTAGFFDDASAYRGLFIVTFGFDRKEKRLWLNQRRFIPTAADDRSIKNRVNILSDVVEMKTAFFDGENWLNRWDYRSYKQLPRAVKIEIRCKAPDGRERTYRSCSLLLCRGGQQGKIEGNKKLISFNRL